MISWGRLQSYGKDCDAWLILEAYNKIIGSSTRFILCSPLKGHIISLSLVGETRVHWSTLIGQYPPIFYCSGSPQSFARAFSFTGAYLLREGRTMATNPEYNRIWMFSNRNKTLITFLLSMCLTTFGLDISMSIQDIRDGTIAEYRNVTPEIISVFSIGAGCKLR